MVGFTFIRIASLQRLRNSFCNRSSQTAVGVVPNQAVLFSRSADDSLCILVYFGIVMFFQGVFFLSVHIASANLDSIQFIGSYPAVKYRLTPGFGLKDPLRAFLHQRDRQGPT